MKFGIIGLGRIGGNLSLQAIEKGHQVVGHSLSQKELDSFSLYSPWGFYGFSYLRTHGEP